MQRERLTNERKHEFLKRLREGLSIEDAARSASSCAKSTAGAASTFVRAAERDPDFALAIARACALGRVAAGHGR